MSETAEGSSFHTGLRQNKNRKPRLSYEYIVLILSFFLMMIAYGIQSSFGVFFKPMLNEFGWTREATSGS